MFCCKCRASQNKNVLELEHKNRKEWRWIPFKPLMIRGKPSPAQGPASARRSEPGLNTHKSHHFVTLLALIKRGAAAATTGGRFIPCHRHWQRLHITASIAPARPHHRIKPDNGRKPENHIDNDQDRRSAAVKVWMRVKGLRRRRHFLAPRFDQQRQFSVQ